MDKFPESREKASAPWDDCKLEWDKHVAETYYSYWEQYTYWVGQGWTVDSSASTVNSQTNPEERRDGVECQVEAPQDGVEPLNCLFSENCTVEPRENRGVCGSAPRDGGKNCERPASSSQHNIPQQSGNVRCCLCFAEGTFANDDFFCECKGIF